MDERRSQNFKVLCNFGTVGNPLSGVLLVSNTLYGTANTGGPYGHGTVYALNTDGADCHPVCNFSEYEGLPRGAFVISDAVLYTTGDLGAADGGSIIEAPIDGTSQVPINWYDFASVLGDAIGPDGLILSDGVFYGVTRYGGPFNHGTPSEPTEAASAHCTVSVARTERLRLLKCFCIATRSTGPRIATAGWVTRFGLNLGLDASVEWRSIIC